MPSLVVYCGVYCGELYSGEVTDDQLINKEDSDFICKMVDSD